MFPVYSVRHVPGCTDQPVRGTAHLTLPPRRDGPLPLPPKGGEGLVSRQEYSWLSVTALGAGREQAIPLGHSPENCYNSMLSPCRY